MDTIIQQIIQWTVEILIASALVPLGALVHEQVKIWVSSAKTRNVKSLEEAINNPVINKFVSGVISNVENRMGSGEGQAKLMIAVNLVSAWARKVNPALIPIVTGVVQGVFDGLRESDKV